MTGVYFAEYLPNIKAISLSIQLDDGSYPTKLEFPNVKNALLLFNRPDGSNDTMTIRLPVDIKASIMSVEIHKQTSTLSFRLPASPDLDQTGLAPSNGKFEWTGIKHPFEARDMTADVIIQCSSCENHLIRKNSINTWKSLPSENWAELMDFWHCHKPHEHNHNHTESKDYTRAVAPVKQTGMVGSNYFAFNSDDVINIEIIDKSVHCMHCRAKLGIRDELLSIRLMKWSLHIIGSPLKHIEQHFYATSTICEQMEFHSIYCFYLQCEDEHDIQYETLIKVFNPSIIYTTSGLDEPKSAIKVFYSTDRNVFPSLMQITGDVEMLKFPRSVLQSVQQHLEKGNGMFPDNAKGIGKWKAGILQKM